MRTFTVAVPRYGLTLHPWDEWKKSGGVPKWWTAYNKTKHERHTQYHQANLKNAMNAVAGLFVVNLYLSPSEARTGQLVPLPSLFRADASHVNGTTFGNFGFGIDYKLKAG